MIAARQEYSLSDVVGHPALRAASQAMLHLSDSQAATATAHKVIDRVARAFNIAPTMDDTEAFGDSRDDPAYFYTGAVLAVAGTAA